MNLKRISSVLVGLAAACAANAATTDLGVAVVGSPLSFGGLAAPGAFIDNFAFTLPANGGSGYNVSDFTLIPSAYNTVFTSLTLVSNPDGIFGNGDDVVVATATSTGAGSLGLTFAPNAGGIYYLAVGGRGTGPLGGIYNGAISVSPVPVPEPETYALMLAGIAAVGFVVMRRRG
jgi:hypothetical protein